MKAHNYLPSSVEMHKHAYLLNKKKTIATNRETLQWKGWWLQVQYARYANFLSVGTKNW